MVAGVTQINFVLPAQLPVDDYSFTLRVGGYVSAFTFVYVTMSSVEGA